MIHSKSIFIIHLNLHTEKYEACQTEKPLTSISINWNTSVATLIFNDTPKWYSAFVKSTCCYSEISRSGSGENADNLFK